MPEEKTEVIDDLTPEQEAWLTDEDVKADETEKKIASGEIPQDAIAGWESENWQTKASTPAPEDQEL